MADKSGSVFDYDYDPIALMYDGNGTNETKNCSMYMNDYCESDEDYENRMLEELYPNRYEWVIIGAHFIVFIMGLVGNTLVCIAVFRNSTMRTVTNVSSAILIALIKPFPL